VSDPTARFADLLRGPLSAVGRVWAPGQDAWTLQPRKLVNRDLLRQVEVEPFRVRPTREPVTVAADVAVGAEVARRLEDLSRYHGFFVLDAYFELQVADDLAIDLNLEAFNPSASDGYRVSSQVLPGLALTLDHELATVAGSPLRVHLVAPDLDLVTIGRGLLMEETPLEGFAVGAGWRELEARVLFGGRAFWGDDDFLSTTLCAQSCSYGFTWVRWLTETQPSALDYPGGIVPVQGQHDTGYGRTLQADYLTAFGQHVVGERLRLAAEYGLRLDQPRRQGVLARVDWLALGLKRGWSVHLGYQFRFYGRGFGPRATLATPTTIPELPYREWAYATNAYEYLGVSSLYTQWSHTVMAEAEVPVSGVALLFAQGELWWRALQAPAGVSEAVWLSDFGRAPGAGAELFYRAGLRLLPWSGRAHRLSAFVTNKLVTSRQLAQQPAASRFTQSTVLALQAEVFL
jgi:hypothetical protein